MVSFAINSLTHLQMCCSALPIQHTQFVSKITYLFHYNIMGLSHYTILNHVVPISYVCAHHHCMCSGSVLKGHVSRK